MAEDMRKAVYMEFHRKPADENEMLHSVFPGEKWRVQIEKIIELPREEFLGFADELYGHFAFLYDNGEYMYFDEDEDCAHCLLVMTPDRREGILAQAEGFPYVRYGAYVPDCNVLDLSGISVESQIPRTSIPERPITMQNPAIQNPKNGNRSETYKNRTKEREER